MSLDHGRIRNEIIQGYHAVNIESIQLHHPHLCRDIKRSELLQIIEPLQKFITTWKVYENKTLVLPLVPGEPYDFSVKWGDGSGEEEIKLVRGWNNADENKSNTGTHVYPAQGVYTVQITGAIRGFHRTGGSENRSLCAEDSKDGVLISVRQWGLVQLTSCQNMFSGSRITDLIWMCNAPDLRWCTDMSGMFQDSTNFNCNLSTWDVSNVTNMCAMFGGCYEFNRPLWPGKLVANVTDMKFMFGECRLFNQYIGDWDVSNVTDMSYMFHNCLIFNQPMGDWIVSKVEKMTGLFYACGEFNQYIGGWDVSNVTDMSYMFHTCSWFNNPIGNWDMSEVTDMSYMFYDCIGFNQPVGGWDVSKVTDMRYVFHNCILFNQPIGGWDVSKVTYMNCMFYNCVRFNQPLWWDVFNVKETVQMFFSCRIFNKPIGGWELPNCYDMTDMLSGCVKYNQYHDEWTLR
jgi:surface protein